MDISITPLLATGIVFTGVASAAAVSMRRPLWGISLCVLSFPLYIIRIRSFFPPTNAWEALVMAVALALIMRACIDGSWRARIRMVFIRTGWTILCATGVLFAGVIIAAALSENPRVSFGIVKGWFAVPALLALLILAHGEKERDIRALAAVFLGSAATVGGIALSYAARGDFTYDGRLRSFFPSPNYLAMYLSPAVVLAGAAILTERKRGTLAFLWASVFLGAAPLFLTFSLGAWIAVCGTFWTLGIAFLSQRFRAKVLVGASILALFLSIIAPLLSSALFSRGFQFFGSDSAAARVLIWRGAYVIGLQRPLFGIGPGTFQDEYDSLRARFPSFQYDAAEVSHPHNLLLTFWLYGGVLGISGFLVLCLAFFKKKAAAPHWWIVLPILAVLIHGIFDTTYWKNDLAGQFWTLLALGLSLGSFRGRSAIPETRQRHRLGARFLPLLARFGEALRDRL